MKTSVLHQTPRTEDDAFLFDMPALLLAAALTLCGLTLMLGAMTADPVPAAAAPVTEPPSAFVGA